MAQPESRRIIRGLDHFLNVHDASIERGRDQKLITEAELQRPTAECPEDVIERDAAEVLFTFLQQGDLENVRRMLTFTAICTPTFLNRVWRDGGPANAMWHVTFLTAALGGMSFVKGNAPARIRMARLLANAGCTVWNEGFEWEGHYGLSAFSMLCDPGLMRHAPKGEHLELAQLALQAGANPHARSRAVGALTPAERAAKLPYALF